MKLFLYAPAQFVVISYDSRFAEFATLADAPHLIAKQWLEIAHGDVALILHC
jgi:hypothetical protein